jgi:hypothetical protein
MLESINAKPVGYVKIFAIENGNRVLIADKQNAILPTANRVLAHNLTNQPGTFIDTMEIWEGLIMKASINTVTASVSAPPGGPYESHFNGFFDTFTFYGNYDKVVLKASGIDGFSELVLGTPLSKSPTQQIAINWKIKFI